MALRALIEAMLDQVRNASRRTALWTPEERADAEAQLAAIMSRVRSEALAAREGESALPPGAGGG